MAGTATLENDLLKMELTVEPALRVRLEDKRNGSEWVCPSSPFVLRYWHAPYLAERRSLVDRAHGWEFRLIPDDHRLALQCTWPRAACGFRVLFEFHGPSLRVRLPGKRLVENRPAEIRHMALDVLAGFGGAKAGEEGFLLIPCERGALCRFDKTEEHETALLFHTGGECALTAPVFGLARGTAGFLGIVAEGEFDTELVAASGAGPERDLHIVHPRAKVRFHPADALDEDAAHEFVYTFLTGEDVSYTGMAKAYRTYLTEELGHRPLEDRFRLHPPLAALARSTTLRIHLAEKRRMERMSGDGELRVQTTFDEAARIADEAHRAGIEGATFVFIGWNCEGRDGLYPTRFPVESAVGGADAMTRAVEHVRSLGFLAGALDNYTDMYRRSPAFREACGARQLGGEPWRGGAWAGGQAYVICPQQAHERYVQRDMRRLSDLGVQGLLVLDHCPGPGVLRCYAAEHPLTRAQYAEHVRALIQASRSAFGLCRVSGLNTFAALQADSCMCPVQEKPNANTVEEEWYLDETVPFLPLALHGLVVLAAEADPDPLRVAEYGAAPVFDVSAGERNHVLPKIADFHRRYTAELAPLVGRFVESHETPGDGLVAVTYTGGTRVLVNRTDEAATVDGVEVPAQDFRVQR